MSEETFRKISDQLERLIRLQAWIAVKAEPSEQAKVALLDSLGFRPVEIAKMLNKTPENVGVVLSNLRKKANEKKPTPQSATTPTQTTISSSDQEAPPQ